MARHKRSLCARLPPEPGHIPELLLDTAVPLSEEAPIGPAAPRPPDLPEDPIDMSTQPGELPPEPLPLFFSALFTVTPNEEEQPRCYCTPSDLPESFIVKLHFFIQSSHQTRVSRPKEERTRSRSGSGSGSRDTSRGRGSRRRRERGSCRSCRSWRDWREKQWASYCTSVP